MIILKPLNIRAETNHTEVRNCLSVHLSHI